MGSPDPLIPPGDIIVLFDGVCNLCNGAVQFIIKRDPAARIHFASLQSDYGQRQLMAFRYPVDSLYSILVIDNRMIYEKSDAAFRIASRMTAPWRWLTVLRFVPRFIRDGVYDLIARSRYRIFGKKDSCMIPTPELKSRFLG